MKKTLISVVLSVIVASQSFAQPDGSLDLSFNPDSGFDNAVTSIAIQPDGKVIAVGHFSEYNGVVRQGIARLNTDGSLDLTFDPGSGFVDGGNGGILVESVVLQPDGKIVVGGAFTEFNGIGLNSIARLNSDGSIDPTFQIGNGIDGIDGFAGTVRAIAIQADGNIIAAGYFDGYDVEERHSIVRINEFGSIDNTFYPNPNPLYLGQIYTLALQSDGKIIVGGWFSNFEESLSESLVRLNPDGSLDGNFQSGTGVNAYGVEDIEIQPDGKILIAGQFEEVDGQQHFTVARLHPNGSVDNSFSLDPDFNWYASLSLALQPDGKIIMGCWLSTWFNADTMVVSIVRLESNGTIDNAFVPGIGINGGWIDDVELQSDGKIIVAGTFLEFDGISRNSIARLNGVSVGVEEIIAEDISVFPNPSTGILHITVDTPVDYIVFDFFGKQVAQGSSKTIDLTSCPNGIYLLRVQNKSKLYSSKITLSR